MNVKAVEWDPPLSLRLIDLCKTKLCLRKQTKKNFPKTKREAAWKEISEVMGISTVQLKLRMKSLRTRYLLEKTSIESKRKTESTWYAFNSLQILDEVKEVEIKQWNPSLSLKLIDLYKENECLWRPSDQRNIEAKRNAAWKEISKILNFPVKELKSEISSLKESYLEEKQDIESKRKTESTWFAFDSLQFLDELEVKTKLASLKLIDLYKENECLWRPSKQRNIEAQKADAWNKISRVLNVPKKELKSEILSLKKLYFEEKQEIESKRKTESTWFAFDSLSFLNEIHKETLAARIDVDWNSLLSLKFINLYKERKCLWHPDMRNQSKQIEAWNEISTIMGISVEQLKLKMNGMKGLYAKEKKAIQNNSKKSKWYAFDSLSFMDEDQREESESEEAEPSTCLRVIKWCDSTDNTNDVEETVIKEEYPKIPVENVKEEPCVDVSSHIEQNLDAEYTSPKKNLNELLSIGNRWDKKSTIRFLELMSQRKNRLRSTDPDESGKAWREMSDILGLSIKQLKAKRHCCFAVYRSEQKLMKRKLRIRPKWYGFNLMSNLIDDDCNEIDSQKQDHDDSVQNFDNEDDQSRELDNTWHSDNEDDESLEDDSTSLFDNEDDQSREEDSSRSIDSDGVQSHEEYSIQFFDNAKKRCMDVCRSCLSDMGSLIDMSSTIADGEITLDKIFHQLTGVAKVKGISSKICLDCKNQLEGFVKFRKRAQSSQETLIGWSSEQQCVVTIKEEHDTESIFDNYLIENHSNSMVCIERLNDPFPTKHKQMSKISSLIDETKRSMEENQTEMNYIENTPSSSDCFGKPIIENQTANDSTIVEKDNIGENQWDNMEWEEEISDEVESTSEQEELPPIDYPKHWREALKQSPIIFPCANCKNVFTKSELHEKHNCFTKGLCPICGKYFPDMKEHMRYHGDERPLKCNVCEKRFKTKSTLRSHERTHQEKKIQCPDCDMKFYRKIYLQRHQISHTNIRPYECTQCDRKFRRIDERTEHIKKRHQGIRYTCTFCPKHFCDTKNLKRHLRIHTKETPYTCCECLKAFGALDYLKSHARRIHPDKYSTICNPDNYKTENDNDPIINKP